MQLPQISYTNPVSRGFESVKRILFSPFDIGKWFALGFSAWLSVLMSGGSSFQGNFGGSGGDSSSSSSTDPFSQWIEENLGLFLLIAAIVVVVVIAISVALTWVQSRGKFMFLDNLVHNRALIGEPWREYKREANSLFLWTVIFNIIAFVLLGGVMLVFFLLMFGTLEGIDSAVPSILVIVVMVITMLILFLIYGYIATLLNDFVVTIMYKDRITVTAAWKKFLSLHQQYTSKFVLYALWKLLLTIATSTVLMTIGLITCCIGYILMAIPYIGAVITLPVLAFFRLFGPEFLRQFGEEYDIIEPTTPPALSSAPQTS